MSVIQFNTDTFPKDGNVYERMTFLAVRIWQDEHGEDEPICAESLASIVGCSPKAVDRALKRLAERGHIELEKAGAPV